jgi:hypothetical protein
MKFYDASSVFDLSLVLQFFITTVITSWFVPLPPRPLFCLLSLFSLTMIISEVSERELLCKSEF